MKNVFNKKPFKIVYYIIKINVFNVDKIFIYKMKIVKKEKIQIKIVSNILLMKINVIFAKKILLIIKKKKIVLNFIQEFLIVKNINHFINV